MQHDLHGMTAINNLLSLCYWSLGFLGAEGVFWFWYLRYFAPFGLVFLRLIIRMQFVMSLNIPNLFIFKIFSCDSTELPTLL